MATTSLCFLCGIFVCLYMSGVLSNPVQECENVSRLVQRINSIEDIQRAQQVTIQDQAQKIANLEIELIKRHKDAVIDENTFDTKKDFKDVAKFDNDAKVAGRNTPFGNGVHDRQKRQEGSVAFTAYLDHDVDLGLHQTLKFNKILTNEGRGYNNNTGVFTCPTAGLYILAFYIGERDAGQGTWLDLVINSQNTVDAAVDTYHDTQDLQGGNLVVKRLNQGDVVWVQEHGGAHVEGSPSLRLTTFSGVLLLQ